MDNYGGAGLGRADDFGLYDNYNAGFDTFGFNPQPMQRDTFKQRNDPQELLYRFKLQLLNSYEDEEETQDVTTGAKKIKKVVKPIPGTQPLCNKQGVQEILMYVEKLINSHTVQGNIDDLSEYNNRMRFISNDIVLHFIARRDDWKLELESCDSLISGTINLVDLFLTRTMYNKEREGYGESYKETTHNENRPVEKPNMIQKLSSFFFSGKNKSMRR